MTLIGQSIPRVDGLDKVTGRAQYTVDIKLPGMLYAKVLRSPHAHARILNIDVSRARRLKGMRAIVAGDEPFLGPFGEALRDSRVLAQGKVRYIAEPVVAVAATTEEEALEALGLIQVEYDPLEPVFDPQKAMEEGAPLVHEELGQYWHLPRIFPVMGTNINHHYKLRKGDIDKGFALSDLVLEQEYHCQKLQHCPLETHNAVALADASGKVTVWTSTQSPYSIRADVCTGLGLPSKKVRVIAPYCGGGFGGKTKAVIEPICALLALQTNGRPVKLVLSREEEFIATWAQHPCVIRMKTGAKRDGRLLATEVRVILDTGAYSLLSSAGAHKAGLSAVGPYQIPNVKIDAYCVYTNNSSGSTFRGFDHPQGTFAGENHLDALARELGMDPLAIRLLNGFQEGSVSATGEVLHSVGLKSALKEAARMAGWGKASGPAVGRGIACSLRMTAPGTSSSALVKVEEDGAVHVLCSTQELGQGSRTALAQIVAEEMGVPVEGVMVVGPDTDVTPFDAGTISSRSTFFMGNAVRRAARDAKERLLEMAGEKLEASLQDLEMKEGRVYVKGSPQISLSLPELFRSGRGGARKGYVLGRGFYTVVEERPMDEQTGQSGRPTAFWIYDAQTVELKVDKETGEVELTKICSADEVGKAINPESCYAQVQGCLGFGVGCSLLEEMVTEDGKVLNPSFMDYNLPSALDMPPVTAALIEEPHRDGPYGAKGSGEGAGAPTAAAVANAIYDAVEVRIRDHFITSEKVWAALRKRGQR